MAFPRNSMRAFMQFARNNLTDCLHGGRRINIVVGNESADLDSLISSLLFSYIRSNVPPKQGFAPVYVPLLNIPRSAIRLRPEFTAVCDIAGISTSQLLCLDDIESGFEQPNDTLWVLVDHNKLQGKLGAKYSSRVRGVIDHHDEENAVPLDTAPEPHIVQKAGSCTSLVVQYCRATWDAISSASISAGAGHAQGELLVNDAAVTQGWDAQIAKLAIASILIDTANLSAPGKVQPVDREAVDYLEAKIYMSPREARTWNRDKFYDHINRAIQDIDGLTLHDILIKDYKEWDESGKKLGISSCVKPLDFLIEKSHQKDEPLSLEETSRRFMDERGLNVFGLMTSVRSKDDAFSRELLLEDVDSDHETAKRFCEVAITQLELEDMKLDVPRQPDFSNPAPWRNFWQQHDVTKSRKQVAPLLRQALER